MGGRREIRLASLYKKLVRFCSLCYWSMAKIIVIIIIIMVVIVKEILGIIDWSWNKWILRDKFSHACNYYWRNCIKKLLWIRQNIPSRFWRIILKISMKYCLMNIKMENYCGLFWTAINKLYITYLIKIISEQWLKENR